MVDFNKTAEDYARHRRGFPEALLERLSSLGVALPGSRVLELGCGTGALSRQLARRGCRVVGLDIAEEMLAQAVDRAEVEGLLFTPQQASAEDTGLEDASFDAVFAGQCWHWFDRPRVARECLRLLRPGGALAIAHLDWLALPGGVVEATEQVIDQFSTTEVLPLNRYGHRVGIYPQWFDDVARAGFGELESFSFDIVVPYTREDWRGRIRASSAIGARLDSAEVARFDQALAKMLEARAEPEPMLLPHRVFALVARRP